MNNRVDLKEDKSSGIELKEDKLTENPTEIPTEDTKLNVVYLNCRGKRVYVSCTTAEKYDGLKKYIYMKNWLTMDIATFCDFCPPELLQEHFDNQFSNVKMTELPLDRAIKKELGFNPSDVSSDNKIGEVNNTYYFEDLFSVDDTGSLFLDKKLVDMLVKMNFETNRNSHVSGYLSVTNVTVKASNRIRYFMLQQSRTNNYISTTDSCFIHTEKGIGYYDKPETICYLIPVLEELFPKRENK